MMAPRIISPALHFRTVSELSTMHFHYAVDAVNIRLYSLAGENGTWPDEVEYRLSEKNATIMFAIQLV
jgi:hypothetical protein